MGPLAWMVNNVPYRDVLVPVSRSTERRVKRFLDAANDAFLEMQPPEEIVDADTPEGFKIGLGAVLERGLEAIDEERRELARTTRNGKETILIAARGKVGTQEIADADIMIELDPTSSTARLLKVRERPTDHYIVDVVL